VKPSSVRRTALSLPGAKERETWGEATFRVKEKIFVVLTRTEASVKARKEHQHSIIASDPKTFAVAPYVGRFGWIMVRLATVPPDAMRVLVTDAWRLTAPKRAVAAFEKRQSPPRRAGAVQRRRR
jgi:hypothetical protein